MKLSNLPVETPAIIRSVSVQNDQTERLQELGFYVGAEVRLIRKGLFGSPLLFEVCGTQIAIRSFEAELFDVECLLKDC